MKDARKVLVTGAGGGIGRAIVHRLRADGFMVFGTDRCDRPLDHTPSEWAPADLATAEGRNAIVQAVQAPLCGFVHAAGVILSQALDDISDDDWNISQEVNVKAAFFLTRSLLPRFLSSASVVMIGSVAGQRASPENLIYGATKAALRSMAGSLAVALAPRAIRVNVVAPGLIDTESSQTATKRLSRLRSLPTDEVWKARVSGIPQARAGTVDEVASAVSWLISDQSSYVTGATIAVNGGLLAGS